MLIEAYGELHDDFRLKNSTSRMKNTRTVLTHSELVLWTRVSSRH